MPMKEITSRFDGSIRLVFGSSGKLYAQIINGAPYDLFLSADQDKPKNLYDQKYTNHKPFTYAIGRLALYSINPKFFPMSQDALFNDLPIAIANPSLAPYGKASMTVLNEIITRNNPYKKLIIGENISQVFSFISSANTDLGFVALSQVIQKNKNNYWTIPIEYHEPIKQDAIIIKASAACNLFIQYIKSKDVKLLLKSYGYLWN